ncbi:MAG TPA: NADH-quinone oxidoreductase subunit A [Bacteroidales bacterium]|nr:NADH-quinone oxidoreductase subunit A [Bacteroidales bacterium]
MGNEAIIMLFLTGLVLVGGGIGAAMVLGPKRWNKVKEEPYECGIETTGPSWLQFRVGYYLFAILFLIFDVETVFIVPVATSIKELGVAAFIEVVIFFVILGLGLLYAWKKGALKWE